MNDDLGKTQEQMSYCLEVLTSILSRGTVTKDDERCVVTWVTRKEMEGLSNLATEMDSE